MTRGEANQVEGTSGHVGKGARVRLARGHVGKWASWHGERQIKLRGHVGKVTWGQGGRHGRDAIAPLPTN